MLPRFIFLAACIREFEGPITFVLQLLEWLESRKHLEFTETEYASRVDLTFKVRGMSEAEKYIQKIPESFRSEIVYVNLLKNYAAATNVSKTEKLFDDMKSLFPLTYRSYNQLLFLYKRINRKKIVEVLSMMEKENIKLSEFTYQILIDTKGQSNNISEMEQIFEAIKRDGAEPSLRNQASVARYYAFAGLKDKAEAVLKDMEGGSDGDRNHYALRYVLPVYALLGRDDEVGRIWNERRSNPDVAECIAATKAWGLLNRIEDAEAAFDELLKILESPSAKPSAKHYAIMLTVYANHGMLAKGEDLLRRMTESGVTVQGQAWDAAVKLYLGAGEVEKADAILEQAIRQRRRRPHAASFTKILYAYARRGDVHNAEKIFFAMKRAGYAMQLRQYKSLLFTYVNAKAPGYGFDMRLKSDGVVPDAKLARLLAQVDELRQTRESGTELLLP